MDSLDLRQSQFSATIQSVVTSRPLDSVSGKQYRQPIMMSGTLTTSRQHHAQARG